MEINLETIEQAAAEASATMDAEEVMRLKRLANDGAVIFIEGMEAFAEFMSENAEDLDGAKLTIVINEIIGAIVHAVGDNERTRKLVDRGLSAGVELAMEESEEMDEEP